MKNLLLILALMMLPAMCLAEEYDLPLTPPVSPEAVVDQVEADYLDLIDQHIAKLKQEYNASTETETLLVRRAVENYMIADLVDYTMLIFMAKYNVASGGIEMKKANADIMETLRKLSETANNQMLANINLLRAIKGKKAYEKPRDVKMGYSD